MFVEGEAMGQETEGQTHILQFLMQSTLSLYGIASRHFGICSETQTAVSWSKKSGYKYTAHSSPHTHRLRAPSHRLLVPLRLLAAAASIAGAWDRTWEQRCRHRAGPSISG